MHVRVIEWLHANRECKYGGRQYVYFLSEKTGDVPFFSYVEHRATYVVTHDGEAITCLVCMKTSWNTGDVENRYCGNCHVSHEMVVVYVPVEDPKEQWFVQGALRASR